MDADTFPAGLRVLAVDDNRVCLKILERQLKYCNYNVTVVSDARTALDMLRERKNGNQFDLVISDVVMPNMDGFKLLELIGLEMDLPVIMLSANSETQTIMKGIKHGACDYLVKPVRLEQLRGIWTHVVKNSKTDPRNSINSGSDDDVQKLPYGDGDKGVKDGANHRNKYSKKNKTVVDVADEDNENTSAQKKQRVQWCGQLHQKFVEAVSQIGIDRAVPKKILEIMNVEGLTRENVASHLQKYRIYLRKLGDGTLKNSNPFAVETEALRRNMCVPSFIGSPSSSNHSSFRSCSSYASILRGMILGSSKGIPFEDIANDDMLAPSGHLPLQSPELVKQPSVQLQSCSAGRFNEVAREVHQFSGPSNSWKVVVPSRFSDLGHNVGKPEDPTQGNIFKINQLSRLAHSSGQIPTFGNEYQKKITGIMGKAVPVVGFSEQVAPFSFGNDTHSTLTPIRNSALASSSSTRPDLQIDNSAMLTQVLNGGGASDNHHDGSTVNHQAVSDQVNNINEFLMGTSEAQNVESDDLDDFFASLVNQDFVNNGDSLIDGDWEFAP
ncbi:unnamed protein product [Miscanthus lutarioriparius]|uniref:Two-component response regulator n=1 Tax=Miscanthus lutarioriparius TaxID=422564 RepID=A0A811RIR2_9POAL|nr:unnamed protein product [Miscanthus lutarioriparius]